MKKWTCCWARRCSSSSSQNRCPASVVGTSDAASAVEASRGNLFERQHRAGDDLHRGVDLDQHLVVGPVVDGRHLDHLVDRRARRRRAPASPPRRDACGARSALIPPEMKMAASIGRATRRSSMALSLPRSRTRDKPRRAASRGAAHRPRLSTVELCHSSSVPSCATSARPRPRSGCRPTRRPPSGCSAARPARSRWPATTTRWSRSPAWSPDARIPYEVHVDGEQVWPPATSAVPAERDPHPRPGDRQRSNRIIFGSCRYPKVADPRLAAEPGHRRAGRVRGPDVPAPAGRVARRAAAARRPGLRRRADPAEPAPDRRPPRPAPGVAGRRDRRLRRVRRAVPGLVDRPGGPLADVHRAHRDDLRRPRRARRLEHLGGLAGARCARSRGGATGSGPRSPRTGSTSTSATSRPDELAADPDYQQDRRARRRRLAAAGRAGRPRRRRGRRRQGRAVQLPLGPRPQPLPDDRLAQRPDAGGRPAPDARRRRVRLDRGAGRGARPGATTWCIGTSVPWLLPHAIGDLETVNEIAAARPGWRGRLGRGDPPGRRPGALVGVPRVVRPAHRDDRTGGGAAGPPRSACCPATCTTATRPGPTCRPGRPAGCTS